MDIVRFKGGLGNQMFQYAFLRSLENYGREVYASLGFFDDFPELRGYELEKVFPKIKIKVCEEKAFKEQLDRWREYKKDFQIDKEKISNRFFWNELIDDSGRFLPEVFDTTDCTFSGYWQSYKYFENIKSALLDEFSFKQGDVKFQKLYKEIDAKGNYVSIHVRRGDYLKAADFYGGICDIAYYREAIKIIQEKILDVRFLFFSDDIAWVKKELPTDNAIYVEKNMFEKYENWYDMCLMSHCTGNIIANSSFSWWGAYLNQNGKIVIAPGKWLNVADCPDICPNDWIRI